MPLITPQPKTPPKEQLTVRLERQTHELLKQYCAFIESTQDYVLNKMLLFMFQRDKEFGDWLAAQQGSAGGTTPESDGAAKKRQRRNHDESFSPSAQ